MRKSIRSSLHVAKQDRRRDRCESGHRAGVRTPTRGGRGSGHRDRDAALRTYAVNTLGPLRVFQALLANLRAGEGKLVMNMSSGLSSIQNNRRGSSTGYRESKAALNMFGARARHVKSSGRRSPRSRSRAPAPTS